MRGTVAGLAVLMLAAAPLQAQEQPWCVRLDTFTKNCDFATYNDCMAVASTATGPATGASSCIRNPDYKAPAVREKSAKPAKPAAH
jgi:Protein of unknown function (DUF3551)